MTERTKQEPEIPDGATIADVFLAIFGMVRTMPAPNPPPDDRL